MALEGEYATEKAGWVSDQLAKIDETGTTASVDVAGMAVVVFTYRGPKSGKLYRRPLMRVEHDGAYAAFASKGERSGKARTTWTFGREFRTPRKTRCGPRTSCGCRRCG